MEVSVILPCYNGASTLGAQLDALVRQTWQGDWELIYVDNGSTDGSLEMVESYRERLPGLQIVQAWNGEGKRRGVPNSYRLGMRASKADAFIFCESDDEVADNYVELMAEGLREHAFVAAALDYQKLNPPELVWGDGGLQSRAAGKLPDVVGPLHLPFALGCAMGFTRKVWEDVGDPSEVLNATWDNDFCWRVQFAGYALKFLPDAIVHYRVRDTLQGRINQARGYGRSQALLAQAYDPKPLPRRAAYLAWSFAKAGFDLLGNVISRRRSLTYSAWSLALIYGQAEVFLKPGQNPPPPRETGVANPDPPEPV